MMMIDELVEMMAYHNTREFMKIIRIADEWLENLIDTIETVFRHVDVNDEIRMVLFRIRDGVMSITYYDIFDIDYDFVRGCLGMDYSLKRDQYGDRSTVFSREMPDCGLCDYFYVTRRIWFWDEDNH